MDGLLAFKRRNVSIICGATALYFATCCAMAQEYLPNPQVTPGALNPNVTQENLQETACSPGWTSTIRPSSSYIERLKKRQMRELGLTGDPRDYHEDHLVPLCVGGHPSGHRNLWPQPLEGKWRDADKNQLESSVCRAVCRGAMTLEEGRAIFLQPDWTVEWQRFFQSN